MVNARWGPGPLDFEGSDFRRDLAGIGRVRVAGDGALGASMKTNNLGVLLGETGIGLKYNNRLEHNTSAIRLVYSRPQG